ncbi:hypothetical protein GW915_09850 [bacterium]|nr:hypothetical protein [bacterium]
MSKYLRQLIIFATFLTLIACKVKNPLGKEADPTDPKFKDDGTLTANVISIHNFMQRPYDYRDSNGSYVLRDGLSTYFAQTVVATEGSDYQDEAEPTYGCRKRNSGESTIVMTRSLDVGDITIHSNTGESHIFQSREILSVPFRFFENLYLPSGQHSIESSGLQGDILRFSSDFLVSQMDPDIHIQIDDPNLAPQPIDFPTYGTPGTVEIDRDKDALIHLNIPNNVSYVRVILGDANVEQQECYFKPTNLLRIPSATLSKVGSLSTTSEAGVIHIDFVTWQIQESSGKYIKQLYIENTIRHTQGFEDYGNFQLQSGFLKFL